MCWKQSWAHAINNLQKAIMHIERAQDKLEKRKERNEAALEKKYAKTDRFEQKKIEARITKNNAGIEQCSGIITELKQRQNQLYIMIHEYGISHSDEPERVYKLMGDYQPPKELAGMK